MRNLRLIVVVGFVVLGALQLWQPQMRGGYGEASLLAAHCELIRSMHTPPGTASAMAVTALAETVVTLAYMLRGLTSITPIAICTVPTPLFLLWHVVLRSQYPICVRTSPLWK